MQQRLTTLLLGLMTMGLATMAQTPAADSLRQVIQTQSGEDRTKSHKQLMLECIGSGDLEATLQAIDEWRDYEASQKNVKNEADARWDRVIILYNSALYDSIVAQAPSQLEWFRQNKRWEDYYSTWRFYIFSYHYTSKAQTALREAQQMLDDAQQRNNNYGRAWAYQIMGNIYSDIGQIDMAVDALRKSVEMLAKENDESEYTDQAYNLLCQVLNEKKNFQELERTCATWLKNIEQRAAKDEKGKDGLKRSYLSYHQNHFNLLLAKDQLDEAVQELRQAEELNRELGSENEQKTIYRHHAQIAMRRNNIQQALAYSDSLISLQQDNKNDMLRAEILLQAGRGAEAAVIYRDILQQNDSVYTRESRIQLDELNTLFHIDELRMKSQLERSTFIIGIAGLLLLALIVFMIFRHRAAKRLEVAHEELKQAYGQLEETTTAKERIESELRIARDIQMSMVPNEFPKREGLDLFASMAPAKEVGGDLYGYLLMGDKLYFCVGDVSGKGVPASLFMAQAARLFHTLAGQHMMPAEIATHMNAELTGGNEQGMFVTIFLGLVDLKTGHLHFCNAGHNPPVLGGTATHGDFMQIEANAPIGLWPDIAFVGEEIESIKGHPLFIYTDGLNEAENKEQEQFGDKHLLDILRSTHFENAQQVIQTLETEVERHRDGAEPNDDLTMMCLKIS